MKLVAVDHQPPHLAPEIAAALEDAGLHPKFDDLPRYSLSRGRHQTTTPIYVPEEEVEQARAVLAQRQDAANERMRLHLDRWWRPLVVPMLVAVGIGVFFGITTGNPLTGLGAWFLSLLAMLQLAMLLKGAQSRRKAKHRDGER